MVDYTSPHPKFDSHMKKYDKNNMTPSQRIKHLNEGVIIRKAKKKTINDVNQA